MAAEQKTGGTTLESNNDGSDYKQKYKTLKRKLKGLVYEHELLSEQLGKSQKKLLRVSKDRSFLLDRILQYEKVVDSSSDSDATDLSDSDTEKSVKKKPLVPQAQTPQNNNSVNVNSEDSQDASNKKTPKQKPKKNKTAVRKTPPMSIEDIERHLDSRPSLPSIEKATLSMPADIFNNVDSEGTSDNEADTGLIIDMK